MKMDRKQFDKLMAQLNAMPDDVMREALPRMKKFTPVASGNARGRTNKQGATTILADYDYADRLDNGWSKQAPKGFTDPTIAFIEQEIMRDIGRM
tara:strand:+ start:3234 stop:3518 length:285 start_codon:yes stop_codon:yes gene_type:complete